MKDIHMKMKCRGWVLGIVCLLPPLCTAQTARLIYSLSSKETALSQLAHPSTYNVVTASIAEKLMKLRAYTKTEIFSVSIADIKRSLVFSDEGPYFEIIPGSIQGSMVVAGSKAYASGREPGVGGRTSVYELALDGSNKYRKLFEIQQPGESFAALLFISPSGTKIGYQGALGQKEMIFIHDAATGKLLQSLDITNLCPDCIYITMGWLADEKRLFLLDGTYTVTEGGKVIPAAKSEVPRQGLLATTSLELKQLSPSGRFAASLDVRYKKPELPPEQHVRGKDLQSGEEKELFMLPAKTVLTEPDVTLNILGWIEQK